MESEFSTTEQYTQLSATVNFLQGFKYVFKQYRKNDLIRTFHLNF